MTDSVTGRFPAILIGGPPHTGKSVLARTLKEALNRAKIECYLLRAAPDGEGDWFYDAPPAVAETERRKGPFTPAWVERLSHDIAYRPLPFLVDVGGQPTPWQEDIFDQCTHAILLVRDAETLATWQAIIDKYNLILLAVLTSELAGDSHLEVEQPVLRGTITQLERGQEAGGPVFEALLKRVKALFNYSHEELLNIHQAQAPTDLVVDIISLYQQINPYRPGDRWQPTDLPAVLNYLPPDEPLALYGRGPGWLYAAVADYIDPHPFYQFDARLGWVAPVSLNPTPEDQSPVQLTVQETAAYLHLKLTLPEHYLDYQPNLSLPLPHPAPDQNVILNGRLPNWLFTGLTRFYRDASWVAVYAPQLDQAVIVASRDPGGRYQVGDTLSLTGGA